MGNTCLGDMKNVNKQSNKRNSSEQGSATKFYSIKKSSLSFQIQSFNEFDLPLIKNPAQTVKKYLSVKNEGKLFYHDNGKIQFQEHSEKNSDRTQESQDLQGQMVANITQGLKGFEIQFSCKDIYEYVQSFREIRQESRILIGRTQYKFVKFLKDMNIISNRVKSISRLRDSHFNERNEIVKTQDYMQSFSKIPQQESDAMCRICMGGQISADDPLISPCDCTGSVKYFHLNCWTKWACSDQTSTSSLYVGHIKKESCQICKKNLIKSEYYSEMIAALIASAYKIEAPFIVLQGIRTLDPNPLTHNIKMNIIILSFATKKTFTIGRSKQMDIQPVIDSCISRKNSVIQMSNDKRIYVKDMGSKHGTYVRVQYPVLINNDIAKTFLYKSNLIDLKIE